MQRATSNVLTILKNTVERRVGGERERREREIERETVGPRKGEGREKEKRKEDSRREKNEENVPWKQGTIIQ